MFKLIDIITLPPPLFHLMNKFISFLSDVFVKKSICMAVLIIPTILYFLPSSIKIIYKIKNIFKHDSLLR